MSNFENLNHYILPSDLLIVMLEAYKEIGKTEIYLEQLGDLKKHLETKTLNENCFYLSLLINLSITESRKNLLLNKDLTPKNKEEEVLKNIKRTLDLINKDALVYPLNPGELVSYMNNIYGKHKFNYSTKTINIVQNKHLVKKSIRSLINESFDEYTLYNKLNKYEKLILSITLYLDIINLQPFNSENELAAFLALYYLLRNNKIDIFKYVSFFKLLYQKIDSFNEERKKASINYNDGFVQSSGLSKILFNILIDGYKELSIEAKQHNYHSKISKTDNVESSIYKLPEFFTKDDVRELNPGVSDATINRVLNSLKDQGLIMPLGTGRSAKWRKNTENVDLSKIVGE